MSAYLQEFGSRQDIADQFESDAILDENKEILLAWYGYGSYCGQAFVLYRENGKLYEVNADHCSCHGIEGQWEPEETTVAALKMRSLYTPPSGWSDYDGEKEAHEAFVKIVDSL